MALSDMAIGHSKEIFGVPFSATSLAMATDEVMSAIRNREWGHVCIANADMFTRAIRMPRLKAAMQSARLVVADGVPLIWLQRRLGMKSAERVYGPDFMAELCRRAEVEKVPVFFYGGADDLLNDLTASLRKRYPDLFIAGSVAPPLLPQDPPLDPLCISMLKQSGARLIFVGLGCPKQELWMYVHGEPLHAVLIGVGQAFSQLAGKMPSAPAWMQRAGLEWCFRLAQEPRRLWKRYLVGNTIFMAVAVAALIQNYAGRLVSSGRD
ncbi:MAG TPA: WecB/TagA/CpsF family glycosyltransferase [Burkholderiales bacterium]|nr:WecB/TagA/CpsF family glycosyltransferase [Burkholderiales bacterium]